LPERVVELILADAQVGWLRAGGVEASRTSATISPTAAATLAPPGTSPRTCAAVAAGPPRAAAWATLSRSIRIRSQLARSHAAWP
jgi:hypothetical protein